MNTTTEQPAIAPATTQKIAVYLTAYRTRHWDEGVLHHYTQRERMIELARWLLEDDENLLNKAKRLIEAGKMDEAQELIDEENDSSGHSYSFETAIIDLARAEVVP